MSNCPTCHAWMFYPRSHRCHPEFEVWCANGDEDDTVIVRGHDMRDAVEKWAEQDDSDSADYAIVSGSEATVKVRRLGDREWQRWVVSGESVPSYNASQRLTEI